MNRPDFFSFLNTFSYSGTSPSDIIADINNFAEQHRPADATVQMAATALSEIVSRLVYFLASLPAPILFVVALVAGVSLVRFVHRVVSLLTRMLFRVVFWAFVLGVVAVFYEKGYEGTLATLREVVGYVFDVGVFFWREWERFEKTREGGAKLRMNMPR